MAISILARLDDRTVGLVLRMLRRRRGWTQAGLAGRAGVSQSTVSRGERGWIGDLSLRTIRALFAALEARVAVAPRWKGAELERLLDEDHSAIVAEVARRLEALGWLAEIEVTYSEYGERGSIDVLGLRPADKAIVIIEVKTDLASTEAVGRKVDEKARLGPGIVRARHAWTPRLVGCVLVMPETMRLRRLVDRHEVIGRMFPMRSVAVRRWLRTPSGACAGVWFLSISPRQTARGGTRSSARRSRPCSRVGHAQPRDGAG